MVLLEALYKYSGSQAQHDTPVYHWHAQIL